MDRPAKKQTMNDIMHKNTPGRVAFSSGIDPNAKLHLPQGVRDAKTKEHQDTRVQEQLAYNENVFNFDKKYTEELEFINGKILIRLFKLPALKNGLFIPRTVRYYSKNNDQYKELEDPYPFNCTGVIVNLDKSYQDITAGDVVQIQRYIVETQGTLEEPAIRNMYYHPNIEEYQGYVLVDRSNIVCKLINYDPNA